MTEGGRVRSMSKHVVDKATIMVAVTNDPHGQLVFNQGDIEGQGATITFVTLFAGTNFGINDCLERIQFRLVGNDSHRARLRVGAVQGSLRTRQCFNPLDINHSN